MIQAACLLALAALTGCGWFSAGPECPSDEVVLAGGGGGELTCGEAERAVDWIETLAARPLDGSARRTVYGALASRYRADPEATERQLAAAVAALQDLDDRTGLDAAERRGTLVYEALQGEGPFGETDDGLRSVLNRSVAVWSRDDEERLVLTEMDIEGWIHYASLAREVQGAGSLILSVADRVAVYRIVQERFEGAERADQIALLAIGPFWDQIRAAWKGASYERQQAWIARAPLPPPMVATSKGYLDTLLMGDVEAHARTLHEVLGPFSGAAPR